MHPQAAFTFLGEHWEKGPAVFKATAERQKIFKGLFGYGEFEELVKAQAEEGTQAQPLGRRCPEPEA